MANIVIHGYNRYLLNPGISDLAAAVSTLVSNADLWLKPGKCVAATDRDVFLLAAGSCAVPKFWTGSGKISYCKER